MTNQELLDYYNKYLSYEKETGLFIWKLSPDPRLKEGCIAGINRRGYISIRIKNQYIRAHRLAFLLIHGYMPKYIDHVNRIKNDNRISNLRDCTISENSANTNVRKDNTSGYKGVYFNRSNGKWQARFRGKYIGNFSNKHDAARVYNKKALEHYGEFAFLNVIDRQDI